MPTKPKSAKNYTKPALREKLKARIKRGSKGGEPGQWSARKAQLLAHEYKAEGGGYKSGSRSESQQHLEEWTDEKWRTKDHKPAKRKSGGKKVMARYLPEKAWGKLSAAEKKSTERKKRAGSAKGKQFVGNTAAAKRARKCATQHQKAA